MIYIAQSSPRNVITDPIRGDYVRETGNLHVRALREFWAAFVWLAGAARPAASRVRGVTTSEFLSAQRKEKGDSFVPFHNNNSNVQSLTWRSLSRPRQAPSRSHIHLHHLTCAFRWCAESGDSPLSPSSHEQERSCRERRSSSRSTSTSALVTAGDVFCTQLDRNNDTSSYLASP